MTIVGLGPGAQVIILQALSTYAAIASAYFFARPILRDQTISGQSQLLSILESTSTNPDVQELMKQGSRILGERTQQGRPKSSADNYCGLVFLVMSFLLLSSAVALQIFNDPAFVAHTKAPLSFG